MNAQRLTEKLIDMSVQCSLINLRRYETCLHQDECSDHIGLILSGKVIAQTYTLDGQRIWLEEFGSYDLLFLDTVFSHKPALCEWVAINDTQLMLITRNQFLSILMSDSNFGVEVLNILSSQLQYMTKRLIEANSLTAKGRICAELKRHTRVIGVSPEQYIIRPTPIFSEFAARVGSTRESVSRTVSGLVKMGVIIRKPGSLIVPDMKRLDACIK